MVLQHGVAPSSGSRLTSLRINEKVGVSGGGTASANG